VPAGQPLRSRKAVALLPHAERAGLDAGAFGELPDGQMLNHSTSTKRMDIYRRHV
jgi:hypothetical protein